MPADDSRDNPTPRPPNITTYTYDCEGKNVTITYSVPFGPTATCEHNQEKRRFRLTDPDGTTTEFHDRAVRFLVVCRDPESGELEPVIERGDPKVLYLCKEAGL